MAADAGVAGFWVARTFATTQLGGVAVPAEEMPGWAAACVTVARMAAPLRPALAVVADEVDEATSLVLELAAGHGISVGVEVWCEAGEVPDAERHRSRLGVLSDPGAGGCRRSPPTWANSTPSSRPWDRSGRGCRLVV